MKKGKSETFPARKQRQRMAGESGLPGLPLNTISVSDRIRFLAYPV